MSVLERVTARPRRHARALQTGLLASGVAYGLVYVVANDVVAAGRYAGYSRLDQAISELSATAAPTRPFLTAALPLFTALMVAFGVGVWRADPGSRALRLTGGLLVANAVTALAWLAFPMTSREDMAAGAMPANDAGHLLMTVLTVSFIVTILVSGAMAVRGLGFRLYSAVTVVAVLGFGAMTGQQAAGLPDGLATPLMGLYERISVYGYTLWLAVFAIVLLRDRAARPR